MRKRLACSLVLLSALLVFSSMYTPALATTYNLGVQAGNYADYTASITSNSNASSMRLSIHNATGTTAGVDISVTFKNSTTKNMGSIYVDVNSNNGSGGFAWFFLIGAGLTHGDAVFPTAPLTINDTTWMIAAGVNRTVNHLGIAGADFYWDKLTGIMVKLSIGGGTSWENLTMSGTNIWSAGGLFGLSTTTLLIIVGVVVVIVVIALAVVLMRRRK